MSNLSRRSLISSAAALPALAVPAAAVATTTSAGFDKVDTIARIAEHRRLAALVTDVCRQMSRLDEELPQERRQAYLIFDRGTEVGKDDDPRWTANQTEYWAAEDAKDEIAWSFVDRPPTSAAGWAALLVYADEHEAAGWLWPDCRHYFTGVGTYDGRVEEDWRQSLKAALVQTLKDMAQSTPSEHSA